MSYLSRIAARVASPSDSGTRTSRATPSGRSGSPLALRDQRLHLPNVAGQGLTGLPAPDSLLDTEELGASENVATATDTTLSEPARAAHAADARVPFATPAVQERSAPFAPLQRASSTLRAPAALAPERATETPASRGRPPTPSAPAPHFDPVVLVPTTGPTEVEATATIVRETIPLPVREPAGAVRSATPSPTHAVFDAPRTPMDSSPLARSVERRAVESQVSSPAEVRGPHARGAQSEPRSPTQALADALARVDSWIGRAAASDAAPSAREDSSSAATARDARADWSAALATIPLAEPGEQRDAAAAAEAPRFSIGQIEVQVVTDTRSAAPAPKAPARRTSRPAAASFRGLHPSKLTFGLRQR